MVEEGELPVQALLRETKEEVNLDVIVQSIIHEDSNFDSEKNIVFTRLVYVCEVINNSFNNIQLQIDEHDEYRLVRNLKEMPDESFVEYLNEIFENMGKTD